MDYLTAIATLQTLYIKPTNEVFALHLLATRHQQPVETLDKYFQALKAFSKDCNYQNVTAVLYREESIRDAFITGLTSGFIRQRLLENKTLDLKTMFDQARSLETAARSSEFYRAVLPPVNAATVPDESCDPTTSPSILASASASASGLQRQKCFFCGYSRHPCSKCPAPARDATCSKCQKKGHFKKVCRGSAPQLSAEGTSAAMWRPMISAASPSLAKSTTTVSINGYEAKALVESGSSKSFIHPKLVKSAALHIYPSSGMISMATSSLITKVSGYCLVDLVFEERTYPQLCLSVLTELYVDLILGLDFRMKHERIVFQYGGPEHSLSICGLNTMNTNPPQLFSNLTNDWHPITTKSCKYSHNDSSLISSEVQIMQSRSIGAKGSFPNTLSGFLGFQTG